MSSLDGIQLQNLLWSEGLDFIYNKTAEGFGCIDITCGDRYVRVEKLWGTGDWVLDVGDIDLSTVEAGVGTWLIASEACDEDELVQEVLEIIAQMG